MTEVEPLKDLVLTPKHPAYEEAKSTAEAATAAATIPALNIIDELITHVGVMPIAWRYSRTAIPFPEGKGNTEGATPNPRLVGLDEADLTRQSLLIEAEAIQEEYVNLGRRLHDLIMRTRAVETE